LPEELADVQQSFQYTSERRERSMAPGEFCNSAVFSGQSARLRGTP
jgi:hypothetical protein